MNLKYGLFFFLLLSAISTKAETHALEKKISVSFKNQSVKYILKEIEKVGSIRFSYNPEVIDENKRTDLELKNQSIQVGLERLFTETVRYKEVGNHIVLLKNERRADIRKRKKAKEQVVFKGTVYNRETGNPLSGASIYELDGRYAAISSEVGEYSITLPMKFETRSLYIKKVGFNAEVIVINATKKSSSLTNIYLEPIGEIGTLPTKSLEDRLLSGRTISEEVYTHSLNLDEVNDVRLFQVSLVPSVGIGSNLSTNGLVTNKYSFNVLGGYSNGVELLEVGGILNTVKGNVRGGQIGGIVNVVGGDIHAIQAGGIVNLVRGDARALQFGGIANMVRGSYTGAQFSGIGGVVNGEIVGAQASGIASFANNGFSGAQVSGICSISRGSSRGAQISGIYNQAIGEFLGGQVAGIGNRFGRGKAWFQVSGIFNSAHTNEGLQFGGIFNHAKVNKGIQIGLINVSDTSSGFSFGLINVVRKGFRQVELSSNELTLANLTLKSGTRHFYNTYSLGASFGDTNAILTGLGFGTSMGLSEKLRLDLEISQSIMSRNTASLGELVSISKFSPTLDFKLFKGCSAFVGPNMSFVFSQQTNAERVGSGIELKKFSSQSGTGRLLLGGQVGIRFSKN